jgi:prepilin peptidase CpaA
MQTPSDAALWFLLFAGPIALWVMASDVRQMRIPNAAVAALVVVFAVVGFLVLPTTDWAWRWTHLGVALFVTFLLNMFGAMGAGDAKFVAAIAPFFAAGDYLEIMLIFALMIPITFLLHRGFRSVPAIRRATEHWTSWGRKTDFPMGLPLAGTFLTYLLFAIFT